MTEHMLRHARVMNAYYGEKDIAGGFGWCMFDYNTHQDFGSGDRICYHGVTDMFRNKKMAGELYFAQQNEEPVLEISSSMEIGEYPAGLLNTVYAVTNADSIRVYKNNRFITELRTKDTTFKKMPHGPVTIDDFVGDLLRAGEGFKKSKARDVKKVLLAAQKYGLSNLPLSIKLLALKCILIHRMKFSDAVDLYGKYIGDWGGIAKVYRFEAIKNGEVVKTVEKSPMKEKSLKVKCSHTVLAEKNTYDVAAIRFRMESEKGNLLSFCQDIVTLSTEGPMEVIGPKTVSLRGGMGGTYVKTKGESGEAKLFIRAEGLEPMVIEFTCTTGIPG